MKRYYHMFELNNNNVYLIAQSENVLGSIGWIIDIVLITIQQLPVRYYDAWLNKYDIRQFSSQKTLKNLKGKQ